MDPSKDIDPQLLHAALTKVMAAQEGELEPRNLSLSADGLESNGAHRPKEKRVGFSYDEPDRTPSGCSTPGNPTSACTIQRDANLFLALPRRDSSTAGTSTSESSSRLLSGTISHAELSAEVHKVLGQPYPSIPKPAIRKTTRVLPGPPNEEDKREDDEDGDRKRQSTRRAHESAQRLARSVQSWSAPGSRRNSFADLELALPKGSGSRRKRKRTAFIPLSDLGWIHKDDSDDEGVVSK